jgi:hypothetical protein
MFLHIFLRKAEYFITILTKSLCGAAKLLFYHDVRFFLPNLNVHFQKKMFWGGPDSPRLPTLVLALTTRAPPSAPPSRKILDTALNYIMHFFTFTLEISLNDVSCILLRG